MLCIYLCIDYVGPNSGLSTLFNFIKSLIYIQLPFLS
jgi:hypothetical protein